MTKVRVTLGFYREDSEDNALSDEHYSHSFTIDDEDTYAKILENVEVMVTAMGYVFERSHIGVVEDEADQPAADNVVKF